MFGAFAQYQAGQQEEAIANYNARLLRQRALATEATMRSETELMTEGAREMKATQRARAAVMGADTTGGTPLIVLAQQAGKMQRDILEQRRTRMLEAQQLRSQAKMTKYEGRVARRAATIGAVTTLLSGSAQAGMGGF